MLIFEIRRFVRVSVSNKDGRDTECTFTSTLDSPVRNIREYSNILPYHMNGNQRDSLVFHGFSSCQLGGILPMIKASHVLALTHMHPALVNGKNPTIGHRGSP